MMADDEAGKMLLSLTLTPEQSDRLQALADEAGVSPEDWLRELVMFALAEDA